MRGVGDAAGPALVQVRLERVEEVAAADRLAKQLLNRGGAGETPDGLAIQSEDPADRRQGFALAPQVLDRGIAFPCTGHQPRLRGLGHGDGRVVLGRVGRWGSVFERLGLEAATVARNGFLHVVAQVAPQVEPVGHLDGVRSAGFRAFGVGTGTVAANHLGSGVVSQPLSQRFGFATVQDIDRLARADIDQDGAVHVSSAESEVVDTEHCRCFRELRLWQRTNQPQQGRPVYLDTQMCGQSCPGTSGQS